METIIRCKRCILPNTLSQIHFDDEGICNHCRNYEKDFAEWEDIKERKEKEFRHILEKAKKLRRPYDCLVPLSGGKDSTYVLYLMTKVYKMRTLAVSLDNGYLSNLAKENIQNALKCCDADHIFYEINRNNSSELFKTFALKTGDFCNACMRGINYAIEITSKSFNIPLIIKGSGRRVQYVSQIRELESLNTPSYFEKVVKGTGAQTRFEHFGRNKSRSEIEKMIGGICDIIGIKRTTLMRYVSQQILLYDYLYKPYPEIIDIIKKEMNWNDGEGKIEHLDCELHDIPFFINTLRIPNITKETFHASGLIRQGIISREEALRQEEEDLLSNKTPDDLEKFLQDNNIPYDDYLKGVLATDKTQYESNFQKWVRRVYHKMRKL